MIQLIRATAAVGAALALGALAGCDREAGGPPTAAPDPSTQTIGVKAAPPTGDPPGTTPVAGDQSALTKEQSQTKMPLEGQNHNYSSVATQQSQKPGEGHAPSEGDNAAPATNGGKPQ